MSSHTIYAKRLYRPEKITEEFNNKVKAISCKDFKEAAATCLIWIIEFLKQI
jgi:hypothetical protein